MPNSLFGRLLIVTAAVLAVFFSVLYQYSSQAYWEETLSKKVTQMRLQNYLMRNAASLSDDYTVEVEDLLEPRFEEFESGLYGYIVDNEGNELWSSYSAPEVAVDPALLVYAGAQPGEFRFQETDKYFSFQYAVNWEIREDQPSAITLTVLEEKGPAVRAYRAYRNRFVQALLLFSTALLISMLAVLSWGTKPLRDLAIALKRIEKGDTDQLEGLYPKELSPLTRNLNHLIITERTQRQRYHRTLSDLAHSLKTPLAVIQNELDKLHGQCENSPLLQEQAQRIDDIIQHQLRRAAISSSHDMSEHISVQECVDKIVAALAKVYREKNIVFEIKVSSDAVFRGDRGDLMEILGNLLDNAAKACRNQVEVRASGEQLLHLEIHDDGEGIEKQRREDVLQRGQRLDSKNPGQGIGLDVVCDIVAGYNGNIRIETSPLGGALFKLTI